MTQQGQAVLLACTHRVTEPRRNISQGQEESSDGARPPSYSRVKCGAQTESRETRQTPWSGHRLGRHTTATTARVSRQQTGFLTPSTAQPSRLTRQLREAEDTDFCLAARPSPECGPTTGQQEWSSPCILPTRGRRQSLLALWACQMLHCPERSPRPHSAATEAWMRSLAARAQPEAGGEQRKKGSRQ